MHSVPGIDDGNVEVAAIRCGAPADGCRITMQSAPTARSVYPVSRTDSPFSMLIPKTERGPSWRPVTWRQLRRRYGCGSMPRKTAALSAFRANSGRGFCGFMRRATLSRPRISFVSRCSIPSSEPRVGLFIGKSANGASYAERRKGCKGLSHHRANQGRRRLKIVPSYRSAQAAEDDRGEQREYDANQHECLEAPGSLNPIKKCQNLRIGCL